MERTDKLTKAVTAVLFIALLAYVGYYIWDSVVNKVRTALAVDMTVTVSTQSTGLVVRDEALLTSGEENLYIVAEDGEMLAAGGVAARAYDDEAALERADRERELRLEIARVETALYGESTENTSVQTEALSEAVIDLASAVARRDIETLDTQCLELRSLVFGDDAGTATQEQLEQLQHELNALTTSSTSDTTDITTDRSGLFTTQVDGWEQLSLDDVTGISPAALSELEQSEPEVPSSVYGKLVTSFTWYFAAAVSADYLDYAGTGSEITLNFGRSYGYDIPARVLSLGETDENGDAVAVFAMTTALSDTLFVRKATAELIFDEYSGIRVPADAVYTDEDGQSFVYVLTGLRAERKDIEIIYDDGDLCLAASGTDSDALREGNEIIISAGELYDGKVMD